MNDDTVKPRDSYVRIATDGGSNAATGSGGADRLRKVTRLLQRTLEVLRGSTITLRNYDPSRDGALTSFGGLPGYEEVDRYWVNAPFSFVSINHDANANEYLYHVVEPALGEFERLVMGKLVEDIRGPLIFRDDVSEENAEAVLRDELRNRLEEYGSEVDMRSFYTLFYYVHRAFRGYGKIDPLMHDPHIEDISCDGYDLPIFVYHDEYTDIETNVSFNETELDNFVVRLTQQSGRHISIGDPVVATTLPDGSRAELTLGREVTPRGSAFTIRKYADEPFTPIDLIEYGTFDIDQMAYLWLAIENNKSLIFAGGTASGKTTAMNAVSMFIPPRSKVLTIEDTRELSLYHDNWLSSVTRERLHEGTDISMYDLLRSALRHRPEYIIVGEVRGSEAITLFQAMNTGHTTYSTMHADSVQTVINRLENEPINVPRAMVQTLDILCVQTLTRMGNERVRRTKTIAEIEGIDQRTGDLDYSTAYSWNAKTDAFESSGGQILEEIADDRGWTRGELLEELDARRKILAALRESGVTDYRQFTAMINEYYADPEAVMARIVGESTSIPTPPD